MMPARPRQVRHFVAANGAAIFDEWLYGLKDTQGQSAILKRINRMEEGNFGDHTYVGQGVWELRVHFGPGYRIYYGEDGPNIVLLLNGGDKHSQNKDIRNAQNSGSHTGGKVTTRDHHDFLMEYLADKKKATAYLNAEVEEGELKYLLKALRNVVEAQGGFTKLAKKVHMSRTSLYKALSDKGNPEINTLEAILKVFGIRLNFVMVDSQVYKRAA